MRKLNKALLSVLLILTLFTLLPAEALAEGFSLQMPARIELTGARPAVAPRFRLELKPLSPGAPMPEGCTDSCILEFSGPGSKTFPPINYESSGKHLYSITQLPTEEKYYTLDKAQYRMEVILQYDGGSLFPTVILTRDGSDEKANELLFTNSYDPPPAKPFARTGDDSNAVIYAVLLAVSAVCAVILIIILVKKKNKNKDGD